MTKPVRSLTPLSIALAALALTACATTDGIGFGSAARPKVVYVSDFAFTGEVAAVDRGYTTRLERKVGSFAAAERKQRTNERVNDELVAAIIVTLREAGLDAQAGNEETLMLSEDAVLVTGRLRAADLANLAKNKQLGFGTGRGGIAAEMMVMRFNAGGKSQLLTFAVPLPDPHKLSPTERKQAAVRNVAVNAALGTEGAASIQLSADTEAQARRLGFAVGEKVVAYAREQGWIAKVEAVSAATGDQPARIPPARPGAKPAPATGEPEPVEPERPAEPQPPPDRPAS